MRPVAAFLLASTAFVPADLAAGRQSLAGKGVVAGSDVLAGSTWAVARPGLPQIRTCAIDASGSSDQGFAACTMRAGGSGWAFRIWSNRSHSMARLRQRRSSHLRQMDRTESW